MTKANKAHAPQALANKIRKKSKFYKTRTNAIYLIYGPLAHMGALLLDGASIDKIILFITQESCPASLRETVLHLLMRGAEKTAKFKDISIRVEFEEDSIRYKLGTNGVVEMTIDGINILESSSIPFRHGKYMCSQPTPVWDVDCAPADGIKKIWRFIPVSKQHRPLIVAWLLAAFMRSGTLPVLLMEGPEASVQSTTLQMLVRLVDWNEPSVMEALPAGEKELLSAAFNRRVAGFDYVSEIKPEAADLICRIATGIAVAHRRMDSHGGEQVVYVKSLMALSGVSTGAAGSDILDRALRVEIPLIRSKNRRLEAELEEEFRRYHPLILGSLLRVVQYGLQNNVSLPSSLRRSKLPDFVEWVYRCAPALSKDPEKWAKAILTNQKQVKLEVLSTDSVAEVIFSLLDSCPNKTWEGRSMELFSAFNRIANSKDMKTGVRPASARALTSWLRRAESSLYAAGVTITSKSTNKGNVLTITRK